MIEPGIVVVSFCVLALSLRLYYMASGEPIWRPNMLSYSFYVLFVFSFICSVVVALDEAILGYDPQVMGYLFRGASDPRFRVWATIMWMFIAIPLGAILANVAGGSGRSMRAVLGEFRASPMEPGMGLSGRDFFWVVGVASMVMGGFLIAFLPSATALSNVLATGDVVGSQIVRREATYGSGIPILDGMLNYGTLELLSFATIAMALRSRDWRWWPLYWAQFALVMYISVSKGTLSHMLYYLVGIGFVRVMVGGKFIKVREVAAVAAVTALLFGLFKGAEGSLWQILVKNVYTRIAYSQLLGTYVAFDVFPARHDFIGFTSTGRWIHETLGLEGSQSYGIILMSYYNPVGVAAGSAGHFSTVFMGEAWANFGWWGVVLAPLWVGFIVQFVHAQFIVRPKTALLIAFYAYLATTFEYASTLIGFYYPVGTVVVCLGVGGLLYGTKILVVSLAGGWKVAARRRAAPLVLKGRLR